MEQGEQLQKLLPEEQKEWGKQFCDRYRNLESIPVDVILHDGDRFDWGGGCEIVLTPGHMPGQISIRALDHTFLITGDAAVVENNKLTIANPEFCLNLADAQKSLEKICGYQCERYLCYHGGIFVNPTE